MSDVQYDIEFARLIGRALVLHERTHASVDADYLTPFELEKRIELWRHTLGYGDDVSWQHYLHANGWSQADLPRLAGDPLVRISEREQEAWIQLLLHIWHITPTNHDIRTLQHDYAQLTIDECHLIAPFVPWIQAQFNDTPTIAPAAYHYIVNQLADMVKGYIAEAESKRRPKAFDWSRERWRRHAFHYAWLIRRMSQTCIDICQTFTQIYAHAHHDWAKLRQHVAQLPTRSNPSDWQFGPAPRAFARYGGVCILIGDVSLIYTPIPTPPTDIFVHLKTWLERRGAPKVVHTPVLFGTDAYTWAYVPPTRYLTDASEAQTFAYNIGALAALADVLGIIGLDRDAIYCAGDVPWILDYGHIGFAMTHQPPLAHQLVMRAIPSVSHAATNTHLAAWHQYQGTGPMVDEWRDDVLAGYQHYYGFIWQRNADLRHMLKSIPEIHQRPLQPSLSLLATSLETLSTYSDVSHGFMASVTIEKLIHQHRQPAAAQTIRNALIRGVMPHIMHSTTVDGILTNVEALSALHQGQQLAHLHMALTPCAPQFESGRAPWQANTNHILSHDQLIAEAIVLADDIVERQIPVPHGSGWLTPTHHPRITPLLLSDASIDHGSAGIGLVLAKLSALPNAGHLQPVAESALQAALAHATEHPYQLGAVSWAIAVATPHINGAQQLLLRLNHALRSPLVASIDHPQWPDGWASLIIGLTALHHLWPSAGYATQALAFGEQLLQSRQRNARGQRTWAGRIAHHGGYGSSGLLTALVRLYEISHDQRFLRAANEIAHSEDAYYDETRGGWPDTRTTPLSYPVSWGYGSLGVAMGRLSLMAPLRSRHPDQQLIDFLDGLDQTGLPDADGLAEGSAGVVDVMVSIARALPHSYYEQRANYWCSQMVARAHDRGGYVCIADIPGVYEHPGVWHGTAGIAYQLARMAYPRLFGSLLAFEMVRHKATTASDTVETAHQ